MIGLVRAELLRLRSRRMTLITVIVLLVVVGAFQILVNHELSPPSASAQAQAQRAYETDHAQWEKDVADCVANGDAPQTCVDNEPEPTLANYGGVPSTLAEIGMIAMQLAAYLGVLASYLIFASFIGAEYSTGSLANWLTFAPQRLRVYGAKLATVVIGSAVLSAAVTFLTFGAAIMLARVHGQPTTAAGHLAAFGGRAVVMAVAAGLVGFVVALVTRHTVAAVGLVLGYLVASTALRALAFLVPFFAGLPPWLPDRNLSAFLEHGATYEVLSSTTSSNGSDLVEKTISFNHSAVYWLVLLVVVVVGAAYVFRRRDVT